MTRNSSPDGVAGLSALIVDDEAEVVEFIGIILECAGYFVTTAGNGAEALRLFPHRKWDVVITDRIMPGMSGDELRAAIRTLDLEVPIILVSGHLGEAGQPSLFSAALGKPFTPESLMSVVVAHSRGGPEASRACAA